LGHWKGSAVAFLPKFHPQYNPEEFVIEEIEWDGKSALPKVIDPLEYSLVELKEMCEYNNVPLFWLIGKDKSTIRVQISDPIKKVINAFIAYGAAGSTAKQYRRVFECLVRFSVINNEWVVSDYNEKREEILGKVYKLRLAEESKNKYYCILRSFHEFIDDPSRTEFKKTTGHYQSVRRKEALTDEEAKVFFPALKEINPVYELIGRILRYYNREIFDDPREGFIIPLEALLRLQEHEIGSDNMPCISYNKMGRTIMFAINLEDELFQRLVELSKQTDLFVFRNKKGGSIDSGQVRRTFRQASELCRIRHISPSHLC